MADLMLDNSFMGRGCGGERASHVDLIFRRVQNAREKLIDASRTWWESDGSRVTVRQTTESSGAFTVPDGSQRQTSSGHYVRETMKGKK